MSHLPERTEKACLNCGAAIQGRFCPICGQENIEPKESFWHLVTHFVYDLTHFDGKFFSTLQYLLFRPGFLSQEYLRGRRADYLHPIRMYVFTSAFFFLIFFSVNKETEIIQVKVTNPSAAEVMKDQIEKRKELVANFHDSLPAIAKIPIRKAIELADSNIAQLKRDTTAKDKILKLHNQANVFGFSKIDTVYNSVSAYDSMQKRLPITEKDNFVQRKFTRQNLHLKEKFNNNGKEILNAILTKFKHLFPQMLFVSLPLFALVLQLLYIRRKNFFYVNHVVFTVHLYCGTFIIILLGIAFDYLLKGFGYHTNWVAGMASLFGFFFWYKSFRNFYEQRRTKTIFKYILALFFSLFIMLLLFGIFFIFSAMAI